MKKWTARKLRELAQRLDPAPMAIRRGDGWDIRFSDQPIAVIKPEEITWERPRWDSL